MEYNLCSNVLEINTFASKNLLAVVDTGKGGNFLETHQPTKPDPLLRLSSENLWLRQQCGSTCRGQIPTGLTNPNRIDPVIQMLGLTLLT